MKYSEVKDFNYDDCFKLRCLIVEKHDKHKEPFTIRIYILLSFNISCKDEGNVSRGRTLLCTKQSECCFRYQAKLWL
jgi:hypothetical protein